MSILINGMKMPKTCEDCSFYGIDVENGCYVEKCYVLRRVGQDKPSWCPLGRVVMCKDCKYRELDTFHGKQRYVCQMDSADPYDMSREADNDEWFCADGEEKQ